MRKISEIDDGTYERPFGGFIDMRRQQVRVLRAHDRRVDEDMFVVTSMSDNREMLVPGDALNPHPTDPETNVEFVARMMEGSRTGVLMQAFVLEAVAKYSELVKQMPQDQRDRMNAGMIAYAPWERCADEALQLFADRKAERG
ncbi:hypothetical protein SAMN03159338_1514 [Sphingomonas sp. NFR04]|nr:hypothetical protein SAMN03159338_1514 [Sphingomonas sp. NFR04]